MRIAIDTITNSEIKVSEKQEASRWDLNSQDVKFVDTVDLDCTFLRLDKEIIVHAQVCTHRLITCSRCLEESSQAISQQFDLTYDTASLGEYLEVDKDIREEILLNFPMKVLCKINCKGLCPHCGVNLNLERCKCQMKQSLTK